MMIGSRIFYQLLLQEQLSLSIYKITHLKTEHFCFFDNIIFVDNSFNIILPNFLKFSIIFSNSSIFIFRSRHIKKLKHKS